MEISSQIVFVSEMETASMLRLSCQNGHVINFFPSKFTQLPQKLDSGSLHCSSSRVGFCSVIVIDDNALRCKGVH